MAGRIAFVKGLNFSKRAIARCVNEQGRRLPGFYRALRDYAVDLILRNRLELAAFEIDTTPRRRKGHSSSKNWIERYSGTLSKRANHLFGIAWVPPSRPAPVLPTAGQRAEQSKRDKVRCAQQKGRLQMGLRAAASVLLALLLSAPAFAQAPDTQAGAFAPVESRYSWSSETWEQTLAKNGKDRIVIFGARLAGTAELGKFNLVARLDASALPDGGGREGSVSFDDPGSFQTLEGYLGAHYHVKGPLSVAAVGGMSIDIEGARVRTFEQTPVTISGGVRLAGKRGYLYLLAGRHDAAGKGIKGLFALRVPVVGRSALIADGAIGGPLSFVRYGVSLSLSLKGSE